MIEKLSKQELKGIANILFKAENDLQPEFQKMLDEGKSITTDEYCEKVVDYVQKIVEPLRKKEEESNQTFDFSEALRRMREGKSVAVEGSKLVYNMEDCGICISSISSSRVSIRLSQMECDDILSTRWKEVQI